MHLSHHYLSSKRLTSTYGFSTSDIQSMGMIGTRLKHGGCVNTLKWSADGTKIITGSDDRKVKIWNSGGSLDSFPLLHTINTAHISNIFDVAVSLSNPNVIYTCAADGRLICNDITRPNQSQSILFTSDELMHMIHMDLFNHDVLYTAESSGHISRVDTRTNEVTTAFINFRKFYVNKSPRLGSVKAIAQPLDDPNVLLFGGKGLDICLLDLRMTRDRHTDGIVQTWGPQYLSKLSGCAPGPEDRTADRTMAAMDSRFFNRQVLNPRSDAGDSLSLSGLKVSADGRTILASYQGDQIYTFDLFGRTERALHDPNCDEQGGAGGYPFGGINELTRRTTARGGHGIGATAVYGGHKNYNTFLKTVSFFGPNDEYIVSGSDEGRLYIWDTASGKMAVNNTVPGIGNPSWVHMAGEDSSWDARSGRVVNALQVDSSACNGVIPHPFAPILACYGIESHAKVIGIIALQADDDGDTDDSFQSDLDVEAGMAVSFRDEDRPLLPSLARLAADLTRMQRGAALESPAQRKRVRAMAQKTRRRTQVKSCLFQLTQSFEKGKRLLLDPEIVDPYTFGNSVYWARQNICNSFLSPFRQGCNAHHQVDDPEVGIRVAEYLETTGVIAPVFREYISLDCGPLMPSDCTFSLSKYGFDIRPSIKQVLEIMPSLKEKSTKEYPQDSPEAGLAVHQREIVDLFYATISALAPTDALTTDQLVDHLSNVILSSPDCCRTDGLGTKYMRPQLFHNLMAAEFLRLGLLAKANGNIAFKNKHSEIAAYFYAKSELYCSFYRRDADVASELLWGRCGKEIRVGGTGVVQMHPKIKAIYLLKFKNPRRGRSKVGEGNEGEGRQGSDEEQYEDEEDEEDDDDDDEDEEDDEEDEEEDDEEDDGMSEEDDGMSEDHSSASEEESRVGSSSDANDNSGSGSSGGSDASDGDNVSQHEGQMVLEAAEEVRSASSSNISGTSLHTTAIIPVSVELSDAVVLMEVATGNEAGSSPSPLSDSKASHAQEEQPAAKDLLSQVSCQHEDENACMLGELINSFVMKIETGCTAIAAGHNILALLIQKNAFKQALAKCQQLQRDMKELQLSPDAKFLFRRGCVHAGLGDAEEALVDLAAAHKLLPTDVAISRKLKEVRSVAEVERKKEAKRISKFFS